MKKVIVWMFLLCFLSGCAAQPALETVADAQVVQAVQTAPKQIFVELPEEVAVQTMEGSSGRYYLCQDYEILIQTMAGGDLSRTIREISGFEKDNLTIMHTNPAGMDRYDFVWAANAEQGEQVGRAVIVDDGSYHYVMTVLHDAADTENTQIVWRTVFETFTVA